MRRILFIFGTRPEAIKLSPVIVHMHRRPDRFRVRLCVTAQHREMLDQVLSAFGLAPDYDLDVMQPGQTLFQSTARILAGLEPVFEEESPDMALVQGDTTTTFCGALAAFYRRVPGGHLEAGLRTGDLQQPFPEEMNRLLTTRLASLHFAPTDRAARNLMEEGVSRDRIAVTGNTGIDALFYVREQLEKGLLQGGCWPQLDSRRKLIVATAHRRESFGPGFEEIAAALAALAERPDVQVIYPVHPNPNVQSPMQRWLAGRSNVLLVPPLDYVPFVDLLNRAYLVLTDSGGIQEEAPSLGKPVLVLRDKTERPEAVEAGTVKLVGPHREAIVREASRLLEDPALYRAMSGVHNPYGDGCASPRIADIIDSFLNQ